MKKKALVFKVVKHNLGKLLRAEVRNSQAVILHAVERMHSISVHVTLLIKSYCLELCRQNRPIPTIDANLIRSAFRMLTKNKHHSESLFAYFTEHYQSTMCEEEKACDGFGLTQCVEYAVTQMVTFFTNNVKTNYFQYLNTFLSVLLKEQSVSEKAQIVKSLVTTQTTLDPLVLGHLAHILPDKAAFQKDNLRYDLACHPNDYFSCMVYMMTFVETHSPKDTRLDNTFPLKTSVVPGNICLDSVTLVKLLVGKETKELFGGTQKKFFSKITETQSELFGIIFKTNLACFRQGPFRFHHMIYTDGFSCSLYFAKEEEIKEETEPRKKQKELVPQEKYIDELQEEERAKLLDKRIVGIDPNMSDLIFCSSYSDKETFRQVDHCSFRYTRKQVQFETKTARYRNIRETKTRETVVQGKTVQEWEAEMSRHNHKTMNPDAFREYVIAKNQFNAHMKDFYTQLCFRKLRFYGYINRQKSEAKMTNAFRKQFGAPAETIIGFGDWEQKQHRKYSEPVKGKGLRTVLRKAGYTVFLVDEHLTSKKCFHCEGIGVCAPFQKKTAKNGKDYLKHGLLKCNTCCRVWNRDVNSSLNIHRIAHCAILGLPRPEYLCRVKRPFPDSAVLEFDSTSLLESAKKKKKIK